MNDLLNIILKDTFSQTQLRHNLLILRSYLSQKIFGGEKETSFSPNDLNWLNSLDPNLYQQFNNQNAFELLDQLESELKKVVPLVLYLGFEADETAIAQICAFARKTFQKPFLILDVKLNPELIAGCALSWKGIYKDYSLKAIIDQRKIEILQNFQKFLQ